MTNFVQRIVRPARDDHPVRSLMGVDFYKFPMLYFIWTYYRNMEVRYESINRTASVKIPLLVEKLELRKALDHARMLYFTESELTYLYGQEYYGAKLFSLEFIRFLRNFRLPPYELSVEGDQYVLAFDGLWVEVELWETIALAIVTELYARSLLSRMTENELHVLYARATDRLWGKLQRLKQYPHITFSDFGTRRRHSFLWQDFAVFMAIEELGPQFRGTSETLIAQRRNVMPMGTNAHSLQMAVMASVFNRLYRAGDHVGIRNQQYALLWKWQELFGYALRIILPDAYGTEQFLKGAPDWLVSDWRGLRQDSGDPFEVGRWMLDWYRARGVEDPKSAGKLLIFSDGLDVDQMITLYEAFGEEINVTFGWGTLFTNAFDGLHPNPDKPVPGLDGKRWGEIKWAFSLVCKVVAANGYPAVKLPDSLEKATGPVEERRRYLEVFGRSERMHREVVV